MYQGFDKGGGDVVGSGQFSVQVDFSEISETTGCEETLVCVECDENGNDRKVFMISGLDPSNGCVTWNREYNEKNVMQRTIGMSQMLSMLHDSDRNNIYDDAIKKIIQNFISKEGRPPLVLDIGTGTGLLAMMCVRHGADFVIGCEMFDAMAEVARSVVEANNMANKILIIIAKSSDIESLPFVPDIIVSELLDSALIGEGVLQSHSDAISRFMIDDETSLEAPLYQRVIPNSGILFVTLVEGSDIRKLVDIGSLNYGGISPFRNDDAMKCVGGWKPIPVHWSEYEARGCRKLSSTSQFFNMNFHSIDLDSIGGGDITTVRCTSSGIVSGVLIWWRLNLCDENFDEDMNQANTAHVYSTEPGIQKWQDHWVQCLYPIPHDIICDKDSTFTIRAASDGSNIWYNVTANEDEPVQSIHDNCSSLEMVDIDEEDDEDGPGMKKLKVEDGVDKQDDENDEDDEDDDIEPLYNQEMFFPSTQCSCGWHLLCGPERIQMMNDFTRYRIWETAILDMIKQKAVGNEKPPTIVDLSDGSVLALIAGKCISTLGSGKVISLERKAYSCMFYNQLVTGNELDDFVTIMDGDDWAYATQLDEHQEQLDKENDDEADDNRVLDHSIDILICECFFYQMHALPIRSALSLMYAKIGLEQKLSTTVSICPVRARVMAMAFELQDLYVSHGVAGR